MIIAISTYPDKKSASMAARALVKEKLAACVSMIKIERSFYRWKGKVAKAPEFLLLIKTTKTLYPKLEKRIKKTHPHTIPEIIYFEIKGGQKDYLEWIRNSVTRVP